MFLLKEIDAFSLRDTNKQQKLSVKQILRCFGIPCMLLTTFLVFHLSLRANEEIKSQNHRTSYKLNKDNQLTAKSDASILAMSGVSADTTIHGKVLDSAGAPLQGVSVTVRGTQIGTTTNAAGEFTLRGLPANATLEVSNVGYETHEVAIRPGQNTVAVTLRRSQGVLSDIVVTGFQRINRKNFTGSAVTLRAEDVKI